MSPRAAATLIVCGMLALATLGRCAYAEWCESRLLAIRNGTSEDEVRRLVGEPDSVQRADDSGGFGCQGAKAVGILSYHIIDNEYVDVSVDANGKVVCVSEYYIFV